MNNENYSLADVYGEELGINGEQESAKKVEEVKEVKDNNKKESVEDMKDVKVNKEEVKQVNEVKEERKEDVKMDKKVMAEVLYFVLGRNGDVISGVNVRGTNKVNLRKVVTGEIHTPTALLCLEEINKIMGQVKAKKEEGYVVDRPMPIRTINTLIQSINTGTYKYWIRTGKYADGRQVDERELKAWTTFAELYQELFLDINFYKQNISKRDNRPMAKVERAIISKIWDNLPTQRKDTGNIQLAK